ncbi:uncharacterized protein LOC119333712 isoform X3 [Triticum dicoccoides]|uniref:uncharacterized protein LOC119333712 isoform X3 n=1 Tax=Triticum dicoccoides TaxID=85692 RepID=UPI001890A496|nr:uncharacterized protein LOC119333712 isoform X3 [Triticum dicoccoides]
MEQSSRRRRRRRCRAPGGRGTDQTPTSSSASSSHGATNPRSAAPPRPHIRQSVLYSDRPRRSRKPTSDKLPVEEHAGEVSSREFQVPTLHQSRSTRESTRPTGTATCVQQSALYAGRLSRLRGSQEPEITNKLLVEENANKVSGSVDLPESKTLALNDTRPKLELTDRVEENAGKVSGIEGPAVKVLPVEVDAGEVSSMEFKASTLRQSPPTLNSTHRSKECAYDTAESKTGSEIVAEEKLTDESDPWAQEYREILKYLAEHRYTDVVEAMIAASHGFSNPAQHKLDAEAFWSSGEELKFPEVSKPFASPTENSVQGEPSTKEIIEDAKKWMGEEVMVAFKKYIKWQDQFKDVEYSLDELQHQCFSVESYDHTFHHFNFTVKMKKPDGDWSSTPYFAQVKEIYGRKYYTCYELSSYDDGHCYACINQGMHALKHPIGEFGYDGGHPDTGSPFLYLSDDE